VTWQIMYDAIHANVATVPPNVEMVAGYDTGTPMIRWTGPDWLRFTTKRQVHIDQGSVGSPQLKATVRDVETGAWTPEAAVSGSAPWTAERPTIYCNQDTLPRVLAAGWKGDLWLAILSRNPPVKPPVVPNCTVVAVQFAFDTNYDRSIVFDPYWPRKAPSVTGTQYAAPNRLRQTANVSISWDAVAPIDGKPPADYTVSFLGLDGREYYHAVTPLTSIGVNGLETGWTYNVHVWANGGDTAPPHASIIVHT
jgi:hypothetical protein